MPIYKMETGDYTIPKSLLKLTGEHLWKRVAYDLVNRALLNKRLEKGPCEVCKRKRNVQAHHDDYSRPLEVRWLCKTHHVVWHRKNKPIKAPCPQLIYALEAQKKETY